MRTERHGPLYHVWAVSLREVWLLAMGSALAVGVYLSVRWAA